MNNEPITVTTTTIDSVAIPLHELPGTIIARDAVGVGRGLVTTSGVISRCLPMSFVIDLLVALRKSPRSQLAIAADIIEEDMDAFCDAADEAINYLNY